MVSGQRGRELPPGKGTPVPSVHDDGGTLGQIGAVPGGGGGCSRRAALRRGQCDILGFHSNVTGLCNNENKRFHDARNNETDVTQENRSITMDTRVKQTSDSLQVKTQSCLVASIFLLRSSRRLRITLSSNSAWPASIFLLRSSRRLHSRSGHGG
jgi:hypothetical protein